MNHAEERLAELLDSQPLVVLATERDTEPYTSLLAFAAEGIARVFVVTPRSSRKWGNLAENPNVSLLIDDRTNDARDFSDAAAATGIGVAAECSGEDAARAAKLLLERHPHLAEFVAAPTTSVLRVEVSRWYLVERFQNVSMIDTAG